MENTDKNYIALSDHDEAHVAPTYEEIVRFLNDRRAYLQARTGQARRADEVAYILDRLAAHKLVNRDINS